MIFGCVPGVCCGYTASAPLKICGLLGDSDAIAVSSSTSHDFPYQAVDQVVGVDVGLGKLHVVERYIERFPLVIMNREFHAKRQVGAVLELRQVPPLLVNIDGEHRDQNHPVRSEEHTSELQ